MYARILFARLFPLIRFQVSRFGITPANPTRKPQLPSLARKRDLAGFVSLSLAGATLLWTANVFAVSPMPAEIEKNVEKKQHMTKQHEPATACRIKIVYAADTASGKASSENFLASFFFESGIPSKDVFEKALFLCEEKLRDDRISEVSLQCNFPVSRKEE